MKKINKILQKNISFIFEIDIYHQELIFVYGDLNQAVEKIRPKILPELQEQFDSTIKEIQQISYGGVYTSRHPFRIIHVEQQNTIGELMSILSHEALHCTFELLDYRGIKPGSKSEEAYTHLLDHIMEIIIKKIFKK